MRNLVLFATVLMVASPSQAFAAGFARSSNFVVGAQRQELADAVLVKAEACRKKISQEWLGGKLSSDGQVVVIHVFPSAEKDYGLTRIDPGDASGIHHMMWIVTAPELIDSTLAHEMTHVVFGCQFKHRVPLWANEGAASLLDDPRRQATRHRIIADFAQTGNWPDLTEMLRSSSLTTSDTAGYAVAASVTEFLLSRADKPTFLRFALQGESLTWDAALWECYRIRNVGELQSQWQEWTQRQPKQSS